MRPIVFALFWMIAIGLGGCHNRSIVLSNPPTVVDSASTADARLQPEAYSLLGQPLFAPVLDVKILAQRTQELESAQFEYDRDPHNEQAIIWLGRRLAYLGSYREAINVFSNGLAIHPENYKLLRHRGHRYISIRMFDLALADLNRAAEIVEVGRLADEIEPDGQPNTQNVPTSTSHTNIYYHLGLVRYLKGDYDGAADAYRRCMSFAKNDDMRVATAYWQYLTLRRLNEDDAAARVLNSISVEMNIIENASYHRLLLMFKGELSPQAVLHRYDHSKPDAQPIDIDEATIGYGIGMWHALHNDAEEAQHQFRNVVDTTNWAAFGHIAAEAELVIVK